MSFVYIIELSGSNFYVGSCEKIDTKFMNSLNTIPWIKLHGSPKIVKILPNENIIMSIAVKNTITDITYALMITHGIDYVRSETYASITLIDHQRRTICNTLRTITGVCSQYEGNIHNISKDKELWYNSEITKLNELSPAFTFNTGTTSNVNATSAINISNDTTDVKTTNTYHNVKFNKPNNTLKRPYHVDTEWIKIADQINKKLNDKKSKLSS